MRLTKKNLWPDLAPLAGAFDSPLRKVGTVWKIASPQDAWFLLTPYLSPIDLENFEAVTIKVLSAADPLIKVDPNERWRASIKGIRLNSQSTCDMALAKFPSYGPSMAIVHKACPAFRDAKSA